MRRIFKSPEPQALLAWKTDKNWQGNPSPWDMLSGAASEAIRTTASSDQRQLCCYCTGSIGSGAFHIEHFRPQGIYPALRFAWPNLLASCESYKKEEFEGVAVEAQLHCGHRKGDWFVEGVTTDPLVAGVEAKFRFPLSGKVFPAKGLQGQDYVSVQSTIDELNLNAPSLRLRRAAILTRAAQDIEKLVKAEWIARYLPTDASVLPEFWPAIQYNFQKHWEPIFEVA